MLERQVAGAARAGWKTRLLVSLRQGRVGVESARASVLSGWRGMRETWRLLCRCARKVRRAVSLLHAVGQQASTGWVPPAPAQPLATAATLHRDKLYTLPCCAAPDGVAAVIGASQQQRAIGGGATAHQQ